MLLPRMFKSVDFPEPEEPSSTTNFALKNIKIDVAQRVHVDFTHVIGLSKDLWHGISVSASLAATFDGALTYPTRGSHKGHYPSLSV